MSSRKSSVGKGSAAARKSKRNAQRQKLEREDAMMKGPEGGDDVEMSATTSQPEKKRDLGAMTDSAKPQKNGNGPQTKRRKTDQKSSSAQGQKNAAFSIDEVVHAAKAMWEEVRQVKVEKAKRAPKVAALFEHCRGKVHAIARRHDSSRIIQTLVKYGTPEQRHVVVSELLPGVVDLCMQHYSKFLVQKVYRNSSAADRRQIFDALLPKIRRLLRHKESTVVVDFIFNMHASAAERAEMLGQFYGPDYQIVLHQWLADHPAPKPIEVPPGATREVAAALRKKKSTAPQRKPPTIDDVIRDDFAAHARVERYLSEQVSKAMDKGVPVVRQSMVQTLLDDWYRLATHAQATDMTASIREQLVEVVHTRNGARAAISAVCSGNAKDRKIVAKSLKGYVIEIATQENAFRFLLAILAVTDDTKLTRTAVVSELQKGLETVCLDRWGARVILWLLAPENRRFLTKDDASVTSDTHEWWQPPASATADGNSDASVGGGSMVPVKVMKKPLEVKHRELVTELQPAMEAFAIQQLLVLLRDQFGSEVLFETVNASSLDSFKKSIFDAIVSACSEEATDDDAEPVLSNMFSSRVIKRMIKEWPTELGVPLAAALQGRLVDLALAPGSCFVVLALAEMGQDSGEAHAELRNAAAAVCDELRPERDSLAAVVAEKVKGVAPAAKIVLALLDQ